MCQFRKSSVSYNNVYYIHLRPFNRLVISFEYAAPHSFTFKISITHWL